jgi:pyruvate,water dikinase
MRFLMRMAKEARSNEALDKICRNDDPLTCIAKIKENFPDYGAKIDDYVERYGDRTMGELKLETISLREDPSFVIEVIRNFLDRPDLDPDQMAANEKELRNKAEAEVYGKLGPIGRWRMKKMVWEARNAVKNRENMRLSRTRAFGLARDVYRNVGRCLVEGNKLDHERDVYYLTVEELEAYHEGRSINTEFRGLVAVRKAEFEAYEDDEPPHHFETRGPFYQGNS